MSELNGIAPAQWAQARRILDTGRQRIAYWCAGDPEAPPLLLIHGFPSASWDWHYLWQPLAERFRVMACDMLGFGFSDKPTRHRYSLLEQADVQQLLLAKLSEERPVHVLAHDYGDSVAQELIARHNEGRASLASCVFLNGGLFPETHRPVLTQKLLLSPLGPWLGRLFSRASLGKNFTRIFAPQSPPKPEELDALWQMICFNNGPAVLHRLIRYMLQRRQWRERWVSAMQHTRVPMRVIDGALDPISGAHMVRRYCELIPSADAVLLDNAGHYPQLEAPASVLEHYLAFYEQRGAQHAQKDSA